jgi:hypothetical protein
LPADEAKLSQMIDLARAAAILGIIMAGLWAVGLLHPH